MTEYRVTLKELRRLIGEVVVSAAYGDCRYVISRYGKEIAFVGGHADLQIARDWDNRMLAQQAKELANPPPPKDIVEEWREMYARGEPIPDARTPEEYELQMKFALEIGEKLIKEAEAKA